MISLKIQPGGGEKLGICVSVRIAMRRYFGNGNADSETLAVIYKNKTYGKESNKSDGK
jgi:hypothetical protein